MARAEALSFREVRVTVRAGTLYVAPASCSPTNWPLRAHKRDLLVLAHAFVDRTLGHLLDSGRGTRACQSHRHQVTATRAATRCPRADQRGGAAGAPWPCGWPTERRCRPPCSDYSRTTWAGSAARVPAGTLPFDVEAVRHDPRCEAGGATLRQAPGDDARALYVRPHRHRGALGPRRHALTARSTSKLLHRSSLVWLKLKAQGSETIQTLLRMLSEP